MNSQHDIDKDALDVAIGQAADFLEEGADMTEEQLEALQGNEAFEQSVRDLLECKRAMLMTKPLEDSAINNAWDHFQMYYGQEQVEEEAINQIPLVSNTEEQTGKHRPLTYMLYGGIIGIAATLLAVFVFTWQRHADDYLTADEGLVMKALPASDDIIMETDDGKEYILNNAATQGKLVSMGATLEGDSSMKVSSEIAGNTRYLTLTIPRGKTYKLTLSDGTLVYLNTDCKLSYPTHFTGEKRIVKLEGEAYFKVARNAAHPFVVETPYMQTTVLGTQFNMRAYHAGDAHVTLISGSVEVRPKKDSKNIIRLTPGTDAQLMSDGTFKTTEVDVDSYFYWNEGFFYFDEVPLVTVMQDIGRWYNKNVVFKNKEVMNTTVHFMSERDEGLEQAVRLLNSMRKAVFTFDENTIYVN